MKKRITDILFIMAGAFLFALAVNLFVIPNDLAEGGVTGITIILYYLFEWSPGLMNLILNGILLIVGYRFLDKTTTVYTIIAVVFNSLFLHLTESWTIASDELWINTIFAGVFAGLGIGLIVRVGGTTAGTVILARLANKYLDWNISYGLLFFDLIVAFSSYFIIGPQGLMCTIVLLFVGTKTMEFIIEGLNPKKAVMIISSKQDEIAKQVIEKMDRGVTVLSGHGYYTKNKKEILYIVISKQEVSMLKKIVRAEDEIAFITIHDVRDVFGEGFIELSKT
ncbi:MULTISPECIES: YitT family protein [Paenibacillus]|uniref:Efflux transporter n=1 Tax=Paenibacillus amylolyticus TaxID=1451 RepID=A0A100VK79_PAEAM|nr:MULTISPECIES: YitT family protein [Paenibacillus]UOK65928.1 YitT family protein [Paenibacillus sp. OVF10]KAA8746199.1 YitT family protein [Paenibacillus sp. UASWS1643]MBD8837712.1 YitT family protein [Paenibacillus sp. CFBP 13594]MBT2282848.1 YitT family protein [Paenibacillus polymyxa]MCL6659065.1 YitT family protein [Paenibacillus amylolyticus]